jgi:hypothetical protein
MTVDLVSTCRGDWIAVYVDGVKVNEGHSLSESAVLDAVGVEHACRELNASELDELGDSLPRILADLPPKK